MTVEEGTTTEVTVETSEPEVETEAEVPAVVVVENVEPESTVDNTQSEHNARHMEHDGRHERESADLRQTLGEVVSGLHNLTERIDSLDQRMSITSEVAFEAQNTAESIKEEVEESVVESSADQAIAVSEPEPDIPVGEKRHILARFGW